MVKKLRRRPSTKGTPAAVVLEYDREKNPAPVVTATGVGLTAERIIAIAKENGIPLREDPDLVAVLSQLDVGEIIPSDLYPAIAEVLAFVYRLNQDKSKEKLLSPYTLSPKKPF